MIATTLPIFPPTLQELFDTVVSHLREQNAQCRNETSCVYRGPDGITACAFGCLIPNSHYNPQLERKSVDTLFYSGYIPEVFKALGCFMSKELSEDTSKRLDLLSKLQDTHDNYRTSKWEPHFRRIAHNFNLTYNEPR